MGLDVRVLGLVISLIGVNRGLGLRVWHSGLSKGGLRAVGWRYFRIREGYTKHRLDGPVVLLESQLYRDAVCICIRKHNIYIYMYIYIGVREQRDDQSD